MLGTLVLELEELRKINMQNCKKIDELNIQLSAERVAHVAELNHALSWAAEQRKDSERKVQKVKDILASDAFPGQTLILIRDVVYK